MRSLLAGSANGFLVGGLASAAGFPWWACPIFAFLSCGIVLLSV